ncbi:MAG: response regulator transcription factor [Acidimicrobiales bacterium]
MRVAIIDDHPLAASGVQSALREAGFDAVTIDPTRGEAVCEPGSEAPDLALVDLTLGDEPDGGMSFIGPLIDDGSCVVMLSGVSDELRLAACVAAGAHGVLSKALAIDEIVLAVESIDSGAPVMSQAERDRLLALHREAEWERANTAALLSKLSGREIQVLASLVRGYNVQSIADTSFVSTSTVRSQVKAILRKLNVRSQLEAVALVHRLGWNPPTIDESPQ